MMFLSLLKLVYRSKVEAVVCLSVLSVTTLIVQMHSVIQKQTLSAVHTEDYSNTLPQAHYRLTLENILNKSGLIDLSNKASQLSMAVDNEASHVAASQVGDQRGHMTHGNESKQYCPVEYRMSSCSFEINSKPSEKVVQEPTGQLIRYIYKYRQGSMSVNSKQIHKWRTTANLILVHISTMCEVINISTFPTNSPHESANSTKKTIKIFIDSIPHKDLVLGILYSDIDTYKNELQDLGLSRDVLRHFVRRRGIIAFLSRKDYPGHLTYVVNPKGGNITTFKRTFFFGHSFNYSAESLAYGSVLKHHKELSPGGHWKPKHCVSRYRIAIIVPFRQREQHLWTFIDNIVRFLQLQNIEFMLIVVEQAGDVLFNRAALMNIGYLEAKKLGNFDCYVFHDVDQVPEDLSNLYTCSDQPRHLVVTRSVSKYRFVYDYYFGGAIMMKAEHIDKINGFPSRIYGWGGEDDEISARVSYAGMKILRYPKEIACYHSLSHGHDKDNPHITRKADDILKYVGQYIHRDGLNSLLYELISVEKRILYTHIVVYIPGPHNISEVKPIVNRTTTKNPVAQDEVAIDKDYEGEGEPGRNHTNPLMHLQQLIFQQMFKDAFPGQKVPSYFNISSGDLLMKQIQQTKDKQKSQQTSQLLMDSKKSLLPPNQVRPLSSSQNHLLPPNQPIPLGSSQKYLLPPNQPRPSSSSQKYLLPSNQPRQLGISQRQHQYFNHTNLQNTLRLRRNAINSYNKIYSGNNNRRSIS